MASELYVETLKGLTSGANANKVIIPSGQTLDIAGDWTPPAGTVVQVVQNTSTSEATTTSTSYVDSNLSVSITPSSASSKILIFVNQSVAHEATNDSSGMGIKLFRDSTEIYGGDKGYEFYIGAGGSSSASRYTKANFNYLDSPNTTSAITYKTQFAAYQSGEATYTQVGSIESTITAMEIAG